MNNTYRPTAGGISYPFYISNCGIYPEVGGVCPHMGTDYRGNRDADIVAVLDGTCVFSGRIIGNDYCGYGQMIVLEHDAPDGVNELNLFKKVANKLLGKIVHFDKDKIRTLYAHLDSYAVLIDDVVKAGDVIGGMGDTGYGDVHLHWGLLLPIEPNERYVLTEGCGVADGYCVEGEPFLLQHYGETPEYIGEVVEPQGMVTRTCASISCQKTGNKLINGANISIMETEDNDGYTWGRLRAFSGKPDEWVATSKDNYDFIELTKVEIPPIDPPDDCEAREKDAWDAGYVKCLDDSVKAILELGE